MTNTSELLSKAAFEGMSIFVTPHAIDKAIKIFGFTNRHEARIHVQERLRQSTFISEIVGETGKVDRLFAHRRVAFVVDRVDAVVITIYERENVDEDLRNEVKDIISDYLVRLHEEESRIQEEILALNIELNMLEHFAPIQGMNVKESEIEWVRRSITYKEAEYDASRAKRSKVAKGAVAFL